ncbi:MAG TPA: homoserine dehydrogenase [Eggerthellaceae bacterium]|nr:homoserine dehydrogenase [Eggerthellaceae bacterium]
MPVKIGLVGTGTVGGGCIDIIQNHREDFKRHYGIDIELVRVCSLDAAEAEAHGVGHLFTADFNEIINDPDIDIVIELIGGTGVARTIVLNALKAGKHVVTANKALMATAGQEIFAAADASGVEIAFEASVGGGIPIIGPMKHSLISNEVSSVLGIVNGTTNYMLTRMDEDGMPYDDVLAEAQAKGFAEADPTADVDGFDAAAKIAILASIAFSSRVVLDDVHTEGIRGVQPIDLKTAHDMGYAVKLLALAHRLPEGVDVRVHPTMIPETHQMAKVNGVYNAIYVTGDAVGETMFFGEGAGAGPAASAVMGDVLEVARHISLGIRPIVGCTCTDQLAIVPMDNLQTRYYIRLVVPDRVGVLACAADVFAKNDVSLRLVSQEGTRDRDAVNLIFITHTAREKNIRLALEALGAMDDMLQADPTVIRVED